MDDDQIVNESMTSDNLGRISPRSGEAAPPVRFL